MTEDYIKVKKKAFSLLARREHSVEELRSKLILKGYNDQVLNEVINNSWSGIGIIDPTSKFIYVNHAFTPILGFDEDELLQMKFENLLSLKYRLKFQELIIKNKATNMPIPIIIFISSQFLIQKYRNRQLTAFNNIQYMNFFTIFSLNVI